MNGLQRTMLGTLMAGAVTFGVGSTALSKPKVKKFDTVYVEPIKHVEVHDTVYIPKQKYNFDIKIPRLIDLVESTRKSQAEFLENGLKFLRKIR